jgi:uncharacterized protein YjbJ (UPF0337 family)
MNATNKQGNWEKQKSKLLKKFANLTNYDLSFAEGRQEQMFGRLQIKLGKTKEEINMIIATL